MKKLFASISATVLGLACLTSCNVIQATYDVNAAAEWLDGVYVDQIVDGRSDYNVLNTIAYNNNTYNVEWSVETTNNAVVLVKGETETKVDVDEAALADTDYTLTATVSDPNGNKAEVKFYATVKKAPSVVPTPIEAAPEEGTAYKLYAYNETSKTDLYFNGNIASKFYLGTVEAFDDEFCVDVYVEYVEGSDKLFNLYFNHKDNGKQYVGIRENWNSTKGYWSYNPYIEATPVSQFEYSEEYKTIITTVDACSVDDEKAEQDTTKVIFWGNDWEHTTIGGIEIEDLGKETNYVANLCTLESIAGVEAADKMAFEKDGLILNESYRGDSTVDLATFGKRFPDVKIAWSSTSELLTINDTKLTIGAVTENTEAKLTATLTLGELTETKEFTITVKPSIALPENPTDEQIVNAAYLLEGEETLEGYRLTGVITKVNTPYSEQYGNITVTIVIGDLTDKPIECYRLKGEEGETDVSVLKAGDTITVSGTLKNYNGKVEFDSGCRLKAYTAGEEGGDEPTVPTNPLADKIVKTPAAATAYYIAFYQGNTEKVYYLNGAMSGFYLATVETEADAAAFYLEETTDGYYLYCYIGEVKTYLNVVKAMGTDGKEHINGVYSESNPTVYTFNTEYYTLQDAAGYYFGTRSDKTFTTLGPCAADYIASNFLAHFVVAEGVTPPVVHTCTQFTDATCQEPAKCTECGEPKDDVLGDHNYVDGTCSVCGDKESGEGEEGGETTVVETKVDLETINTNQTTTGYSKYDKSFTTTSGWTTVNAAIQVGGASDANPVFAVFGDANTKAVCLNGKTSAPGKLTSPKLTGGISKITFKHTNTFSDTEFSITVTITDATGKTVSKTFTRSNPDKTKFAITEETWVLETPVVGEFTIEFVNNCPSGKDSNTDRISVWNIVWTNATAGGNEGGEGEETHTCTQFTDATCQEPAKCTECGEPKDDVLGNHNYVDGVCSVCGATEEHVCKTYTDATCQEPAKCTVCGTAKDDVLADHNYVNGVCTVCGDQEVVEPSTISIADAIKMGNGYAKDTYSTETYYVTGKITEVQNTKYGNVVISDGTNSILVYGLYVESKADENRYDSMEVKPIVGDTIKVLSVVGKFNEAQLKDAILVELTQATAAEKVALEKAALTLPESNVGEASIALIANGNVRPDVTIAWNVTAGGDIATIADGKLNITNPTAETTVTVVATLTLDGADSESKTFNIVVTPSAGQTWKMVTDVSQLKAGSQIVIAALGYNYAIGDTQNKNNRAPSDITKSGTGITFDEANVEVLTLGAGTTAGTFSFKVEEGGYLYAASSSSNYLKTETTLSANSSWTITIASNGSATIKATGSNTRNWLRYNSSNKLFAAYGSGQQDVCIYIYA